MHDVEKSIAGLAWHAARSEFNESAAEAAVAVEMYRRANGGAMPETLAALVPDYLPAVPKNPFVPGAEIKYDASREIVSSGEMHMLIRPRERKR